MTGFGTRRGSVELPVRVDSGGPIVAPQWREWAAERAPATARPFPLPYDGRTWITSVSGEP